MPLLDATTTPIVVALVTIIYGLRWERHYTAWISVVMNVVFTAILLGSTDMPREVAIVLGFYILLGIISARKSWRKTFDLFGGKTFGALSLITAMAEAKILGWTHSLWKVLTNSDRFNIPNISEPAAAYLFGWLIVGLGVHIVGALFFRQRKTEL